MADTCGGVTRRAARIPRSNLLGGLLFAALAGCSAAPPASPANPPAEFQPTSAKSPAILIVAPSPSEARTSESPGSGLELGSDPFQADSSTRLPDSDSGGMLSFKRFSFDAEWIPAMWVTADVDQKGNSQTRGDLDTGSGLALRAGMGNEQQNIGVLYLGSWHDEQTTGRGAKTQSLLLDFLYRAPLPETGGAIWLEADAGLGGTEIQFDSAQFDDQVTGAALLHGDLEFRVTRVFSLAAGLGVFIWGHPGDTIAYGSYVTVGAKLVF